MDYGNSIEGKIASQLLDRVEKEGTYSITQLAAEFGLTTRAIRFYEDKGLLFPMRQGQTRIYDSRQRARLSLIVRGKRVGLALGEIKEIISLYSQEDRCETQNRVAIEKFRRRIADLEKQRKEVEIQIEALHQGVARLEHQLGKQTAANAPAPAMPDNDKSLPRMKSAPDRKSGHAAAR